MHACILAYIHAGLSVLFDVMEHSGDLSAHEKNTHTHTHTCHMHAYILTYIHAYMQA
jgi:hypothetical protein